MNILQVSIIVPNFNHASYLTQRFDSIFNQTYSNYEVIILDDCSSDNSREIIDKYRNHPKVSHIIFNERNGGTSYKQWYRGIELAKGGLIWIAESDDWCDVRFLDLVVPFFMNDKISLVYTGTKIVFNDEIIEDVNIHEIEHIEYSGNEYIRDYMLVGNPIFSASLTVFRKEQYLKVKNCGYRELKLCGDWLLWMEIIKDSNLINLKNELNFLRRHSSNTSSRFSLIGLDLIEGIGIFKLGERICHFCYNKGKVYKLWLNRFEYFSNNYDLKITLKVLFVLSINKTSLGLYIIKKSIKSKIKQLISSIHYEQR